MREVDLDRNVVQRPQRKSTVTVRWWRKTVFIEAMLLAAGAGITTEPHAKISGVTPIREERLKRHVRRLAVEGVPRDHTATGNLNAIASYIRQEFADAGGRVADQPYEAQGNSYRNVIASFGPEAGERLIIGAHYDAHGPYPAADDNASGVAGLLELARVLGLKAPRIRVDLVAWSLEEAPFFGTPLMGSAVHAKSLKEAGAAVRGAISLEMIGFFSNAPDSQRYPIPGLGLLYPSRGHFIVVAGRWSDRRFAKPLVAAMREGSPLMVKRYSGPAWTPSLDWSDHRSYWAQGWPAVMITDTSYLRNPNYHQPTDTPETLDFTRMAQVIQGVAHFVESR